MRQGSTRGEGRERLPVLAPPPSSASGVWWALLGVSGLGESLSECVVSLWSSLGSLTTRDKAWGLVGRGVPEERGVRGSQYSPLLPPQPLGCGELSSGDSGRVCVALGFVAALWNCCEVPPHGTRLGDK